MYIVYLKNLFSAISSIIIFLICRSAKKYVHGEFHEEYARQTFSVFEPEQCLEMRNYKYSFDHISSQFCRWNWCVYFFVVVVGLCWYILFIVSFGCVTIVNREMVSILLKT